MKTWEMLRDIREGETYEIASGDYEGHGVTLDASESGRSAVLKWTETSGLGAEDGELPDVRFYVNEHVLREHTWRKRQLLVDFATAFAAYERGTKITSQVTCDWAQKGSGILTEAAFSTIEIRGKWTIEEVRA